MSGPRRIFVDFNNRLKRADNGEYYQVTLSEVDGLEIGSRVLATDFEDIEVPVEISALLHRDRTAIVKVIRTREFPSVIVDMKGPVQLTSAEVRPDWLELGLLPA